MKTRTKGLVLAAVHVALVLGLGGKLLVDRATRPRFWLPAAPVDPELPLRGRYVSLAVAVPVRGRELALELRSRTQWAEYLKARSARSTGGGLSLGPFTPWTPGQSIPQVRIDVRGQEVWGHLENAPAGTPGLFRRQGAAVFASLWRTVGTDLAGADTGDAALEPPPGLTEAGLDAWLDGLPPGRVPLGEALAFFIPEHVPDPSRRTAGEELWVEVTLPRNGPLRPIRLAVKKDGKLEPLKL